DGCPGALGRTIESSAKLKSLRRRSGRVAVNRDRDRAPIVGARACYEESSMVTERQIEANRQNALKSTGPTSRDGKIASSKNALKQGLRAEHFIYLDEHEEDFSKFRDAVFSEFPIEGVFDSFLVERAVICMWRLRRVLRLESGLVGTAAEVVTARIKSHRRE